MVFSDDFITIPIWIASAFAGWYAIEYGSRLYKSQTSPTAGETYTMPSQQAGPNGEIGATGATLGGLITQQQDTQTQEVLAAAQAFSAYGQTQTAAGITSQIIGPVPPESLAAAFLNPVGTQAAAMMAALGSFPTPGSTTDTQPTQPTNWVPEGPAYTPAANPASQVNLLVDIGSGTPSSSRHGGMINSFL